MRAAVRHLCQLGAEALKPQKVISKSAQNKLNVRPAEIWRRPVVSKRVGNVVRKQAMRDGTYGSFDVTTGVGWEPAWDFALKSTQHEVSRFGGIKPKKLTTRERNREGRALKLEEALETRVEKMEEYYVKKEELRVEEDSFEANFKRVVQKGAKAK
jgi:hypothetical protein